MQYSSNQLLTTTSSFSAVTQAQNVLKELRDRVERAVAETKRCQQEALTLDARAVRMTKEVHVASAECVALAEDCIRQENFLSQLSTWMEKATVRTKDILHSWESLDRETSRVMETNLLVEETKKTRMAEFQTLQRFGFHALEAITRWGEHETSTLANEVERTTNIKLGLEFRLVNAKTSTNADRKECDELGRQLEEATYLKEKRLEKLREAQEEAIRRTNMNAESDELTELKTTNDSNQLARDLARTERQNRNRQLQEELNIELRSLEESKQLVEGIKVQLLEKERELREYLGRERETQKKLEDELCQLEKERAMLEVQQHANNLKLDQKARDLISQWDQRVQSQLATLDAQEVRLRAELVAQTERGKQHQQDWDKKIAMQKKIQIDMARAKNREKKDLETSTESGGGANEQHLVAAEIAESAQKPSKKKKKKAKVPIPSPAPKTTKSVVAKMFEHATTSIRRSPKKEKSARPLVLLE